MTITPLPLAGLLRLTPRVFADSRGFFMESYRESSLRDAGVEAHFVQDNHSQSMKNVVRGLHFQTHPGQAKLIRCTRGLVWDVAVDLRPDSPTFGRWHGEELSAENAHQLFIPIGFAHGFAVLSDVAEVQYKCTSYYNGATEAGIAWNDPQLAVDWRVADPILSERDRQTPSFAAWCASNGHPLPHWM